MSSLLKLRRGLESEFLSFNPILKEKEVVYITDLKKVKIGNGINTFKELEFKDISDNFELINIFDGKKWIKAKIRRSISFDWINHNPILDLGEPSFETDTLTNKVGDGKTPYNELSYI